jgi:hypothetical protein
LKSTKEVFSVKGTWHSPNTLHTMVYSQAFHINFATPIEKTPLSATQGPAEQLWVWTLETFTSTQP